MGAGTPSGSEYRAASAWMGDPPEKRTLFLVGSSLPSEPGGGRSVAPTGCPADGLLGMTAARGAHSGSLRPWCPRMPLELVLAVVVGLLPCWVASPRSRENVRAMNCGKKSQLAEE